MNRKYSLHIVAVLPSPYGRDTQASAGSNDTQEDIDQCLSCKKIRCTNCKGSRGKHSKKKG